MNTFFLILGGSTTNVFQNEEENKNRNEPECENTTTSDEI